MTDDDLCVMIEEKKTDNFRSMLRKPKREDVDVESVTLNYECITSISGKYEADYFRKVTHVLSVDRNVSEVVFGDETFPTRSESDLRKKISGKLGKSKVDLPLEEHVCVQYEGTHYFDSGGKEIRLSFKINPKTVENYPHRVLSKHDSAMIKSVLSDEDLIEELTRRLKPKLEDDIRDLYEETVVREICQIYVPVYEVILFGPKKKTATMRIDAARSKIL